jgi:hypothetical protein
VIELSDDEAAVWHAVADALRSRGATYRDAFDGATRVLHAYRRQRDALTLRAAGEPSPWFDFVGRGRTSN